MNLYSSNVNKGMNMTKSKDIFENLKNDYFLMKVFDILPKNKSLKIIKYNKNIQKRIDININSYKEYLEKYSPIEIEIIPAINKFGNFINFNKEDEIYYHIYFNDNKEEIKRNYLNKDDKVEKIKIIIDYQIKSFSELFGFCKLNEFIYFKKFYRSNINNMCKMFYFCEDLKGLNLKNFSTNNVIDMSAMFYYCSSIEELNLSSFNTNNVKDMSFMFYFCSSLKELNLKNFNTNNVTNMHNMFAGCYSLEKLNVSNFVTNNVTDMKGMFSECSSLKELNLNNFNTNNVKAMSYMFSHCFSLEKLNIDNFNMGNVINTYRMFKKCSDEFKNEIRAQYKNIKEEAFY